MLVGASPSFLYPDAGGYVKSGCDSGEYRDKDVDDNVDDALQQGTVDLFGCKT